MHKVHEQIIDDKSQQLTPSKYADTNYQEYLIKSHLKQMERAKNNNSKCYSNVGKLNVFTAN